MSDTLTGSCLCGTVQFSVRGGFDVFHLCHCSRCRKGTGSAHASNLFTKADKLTIERGESSMQRWDHPDARYFSRCFCTHCGGPVPYVSRRGPIAVIPAGTLEGDPGIEPRDNIFWQDRACWYEAVAGAPRFDADPV